MNGRLISAFIIGAAVGAAAMPALAGRCYEVIDRNDVVILRDTSSPVDLSGAGAPAREAMRSRGELLVIFDVETCVVIGRDASTGGGTLTTAEIVAGWKSFGKSGFGGTYGGTLAPDAGGGIAAPTPTNVGRTPAAQDAAAARRGRY
jgi:hypothetical protein